MKKWALPIAFVMVSLFMLASGAFAATNLTSIKALLNGELKLVKDGVVWKPTDANGQTVLPISYNGTTYLPVRAISNAFNIPILYDDKTKTIRLGEGENVNFYSTAVKPERSTWTFLDIVDQKQLVFGGKTYKGAFAMDASDTERYELRINFDRKYAKLHLMVAGEENLKFKVYNDQGQLLSQELTAPDGTVATYEIDLQGSSGIIFKPYGAAIATTPQVFILKDSYLQ
ncbi:hypothetical protein ACX1C1_07630 [Paenibacillus sp. strain BS8-2]